MTAVGQVKRAVAAAIKAAGCAAIESYSEEQLKRYATAVAAVGTKETVIERAARPVSGRKGRRGDAGDGICLRAENAADAAHRGVCAEDAGRGGLRKSGGGGDAGTDDGAAEGLKLGSLQWGKTGWDKTTGMFRLDASAKYAAYFVAEAAEDETVFTDFILKGTVKERE